MLRVYSISDALVMQIPQVRQFTLNALANQNWNICFAFAWTLHSSLSMLNCDVIAKNILDSYFRQGTLDHTSPVIER